jgi:hypothetical protein
VKVVAHRVGSNMVALFCRPLFGNPRTVYAHWTGTEWSLSSGRPCSRRMLAAIDGLAMTFEAVSK